MRNTSLALASLGFFSLFSAIALAQDPPNPTNGEIRLIVRADDMGVCRTANEACIKAYREGIARSVEVIVNGAWFLDAAKLCNENPKLDVGVHLCLNSEWELCKWRPLTGGRSIADADGYFFPMPRQRPDFPPNTGFLDAKPKLEEVEAELRAQIEMARKHIRNVTHLSAHMYTPIATPELRAIAEKLSKEYNLPLECPQARPIGHWGEKKSPAEREAAFITLLENAKPGLWLFVEHPGLDTPEMRGLGHKGYWDVAADRAGVTFVMTSDKVKQVIQRRGIRLISYAQAYGR